MIQTLTSRWRRIGGIFVRENVSICEYCRVQSPRHQRCCPEGDTISVQMWRAGHHEALNGRRNACADDEIYTLGFTSGETERERLNANEKRDRPSAPEELFPEEAAEDRPSLAPMSVSEFSLIVDEIRNPPLADEKNELSDKRHAPPVPRADAKAVYDREIAARHADLY
ncbi:MAG: hypothetical protein AAB668_03900 [Patescibacteria group bacterium]